MMQSKPTVIAQGKNKMPIGVTYGLAQPEMFALWTLTEREKLVRFTRAIYERE